MYAEESLVIKKFILRHVRPGSRVLNIGSADALYRTYIQPYIGRNIDRTFETRGCSVTNLDMAAGEDIDLVMNVSSLRRLEKRYDVVLCCNVFEHVRNPKKLARDIVRLTKPGGVCILTAPHVHPYHEDPIDTMFRPSLTDLCLLFPHVKRIEGTTLVVRSSYETRGLRLPLWFMRSSMTVKSCVYALRGSPFSFLSDVRTVWGRWEMTYAVFQKPKH